MAIAKSCSVQQTLKFFSGRIGSIGAHDGPVYAILAQGWTNVRYVDQTLTPTITQQRPVFTGLSPATNQRGILSPTVRGPINLLLWKSFFC